jgi:hypothetical protein
LRNIGSRWRNLADGLLRIETLEAQLLVVALLMLALSIVLLRIASPAATIVLHLAFLLPTVLAIWGVLFLLRSPDPIRVPMNLPDVWWHIIPKHDAPIRRSGSTLAARR